MKLNDKIVELQNVLDIQKKEKQELQDRLTAIMVILQEKCMTSIQKVL